MRQLAPLFRISKSAADRIIDHLGPIRAPAAEEVPKGHGALCRRPSGWEESGAEAADGKTMTIADGGYQGTDPDREEYLHFADGLGGSGRLRPYGQVAIAVCVTAM